MSISLWDRCQGEALWPAVAIAAAMSLSMGNGGRFQNLEN